MDGTYRQHPPQSCTKTCNLVPTLLRFLLNRINLLNRSQSSKTSLQTVFFFGGERVSCPIVGSGLFPWNNREIPLFSSSHKHGFSGKLVYIQYYPPGKNRKHIPPTGKAVLKSSSTQKCLRFGWDMFPPSLEGSFLSLGGTFHFDDYERKDILPRKLTWQWKNNHEWRCIPYSNGDFPLSCSFSGYFLPATIKNIQRIHKNLENSATSPRKKCTSEITMHLSLNPLATCWHPPPKKKIRHYLENASIMNLT